jgi:hypothetical protein
VDVNELRDTIAEKTSLTMEQAREAAAATAVWLQDNMPDDASDQIRNFAASAGDWIAQTTKDAGDAAADMLDKIKGSDDEGPGADNAN